MSLLDLLSKKDCCVNRRTEGQSGGDYGLISIDPELETVRRHQAGDGGLDDRQVAEA